MAAPIKDGLTNSQRYYRRHRAEVLEKQKRAYGANPQAFRDKQKRSKARRTIWQRRYLGLPEPTRPEPAGCELCGKTFQERALAQALCVDHDHTTGKFRGWLCTMCNIGLGNLGDDIAGLERAAQYLWRANENLG